MLTEAAAHADFSRIRYAQCWEDADILLEALNIQPGDRCLAIASAGDNALSMLTCDPAKVYAIDLSPAQLACLELRVAAYRCLDHPALLELIGSRPSQRREDLYHDCRSDLDPQIQHFWDQRLHQIRAGIGSVGKFEHYFAVFRRWILPLIHSRSTVDQLLQGGSLSDRQVFYNSTWNTWQWQTLFRIFFSRAVMGRLGRDPAFFRYVEGSVADRILARTRHALTELDPAENPYLQWILTGQHLTALPHALRPDQFDLIRQNLDRLEWRLISLEAFLQAEPDLTFQRFNLSDIFEYMSESNCAALLAQIAGQADRGARLVYWNMLVPRSCPIEYGSQLRSLSDLAATLHQQDKAFFYSRLVIEEVI